MYPHDHRLHNCRGRVLWILGQRSVERFLANRSLLLAASRRHSAGGGDIFPQLSCPERGTALHCPLSKLSTRAHVIFSLSFYPCRGKKTIAQLPPRLVEFSRFSDLSKGVVLFI